MRRLVAATIAATTLTLAVALGAPAFAADADASVKQIYEAAEAGHLDQAQSMMDQVLKDHPQSARAHYVQAELYAKEGKLGLARSELSEAESLKPGLPFENPQSVQHLKAQLGVGGAVRSQPSTRPIAMESEAGARHFPWGMVLIVVAAVGVLWMLFRRRPAQGVYPMGATPAGGAPGGYGGPGGGGYAPGPMGGGGIGSAIGGGLASGLAVGAGVVAGEEIAHHFLDGRPEGSAPPVADNSDWGANNASNNDMGGADFGVNDSSGGWDDGGGGGGGGGDDWS